MNRFYRKFYLLCILFVLLGFKPTCSYSLSYLLVSESHFQKIKLNLQRRELGRNGLIDWNASEDFASLGLMHATWGSEKTIKHGNTFSQFVKFASEHGYELPNFLTVSLDNPWSSRKQFFASKYSNDIRMVELQKFLEQTTDLQVQFLIDRVYKCLNSFLLQFDSYDSEKELLLNLISTSEGLLAVIDYINFKGEGKLSDESKWGLLNVLEFMKNFTDRSALNSFIASAKMILMQRHPKYQIYAEGWNLRLEGYRSSRA